MKKIFLVIICAAIVSSASPVLAVNGQTQLPTKFDYAKEWFNLNLLTFKTQSKVILINRYAASRTEEIKTAVSQNNSTALTSLASRYSKLVSEAGGIIQKAKNNQSALIDIAKTNILSQQKTLSEARQNASAENDQKTIASAQEQAVDTIKQNLTASQSVDIATEFTNQVIAVWRDPAGEVMDETGTRVYASGTDFKSGDVANGIVIDGGQAKITNENNQLKIEYAPSTGPNSVVSETGKKVWKIVQSDGSTIDSYQSASGVVIGQNTGTAGNVVVGSNSGATNVVIGSGGAGEKKIVGGMPVVKTGQVSMESGSPASDPSQTQNNSLNSTNSLNGTNTVSGSGDQGQVQPAVQVAPQGSN